MTDKRKTRSGTKSPKVENLALNRETVQELTEDEAQAVQGGMRKAGGEQEPFALLAPKEPKTD
jgi:hypothetical protein